MSSNHLDPAAVQTARFRVHPHAMTPGSRACLTEAAGRLNDPHLFELLVHDKSESLYRVLPAFLRTSIRRPTPESYEALRQVVPASATSISAPARSNSILGP